MTFTRANLTRMTRGGAPSPTPPEVLGLLPDAALGVSYLSSGDVTIFGGTGPFTASLSGQPSGLNVTVSGRDLIFDWSNPA